MLLLVGLRFVPAWAAEPCGPAPDDASARIVAITDAFDVRLDDGRVLRLAGLDLPVSAATRPRPPAPAAADPAPAAHGALDGWAAAGPVAVHALSAVPDRWNRIPALLFRPGAPEPSAAVLLLGKGLARARPEPLVHSCFSTFLAAEEAARAARRGLWGESGTGVLRPDDGDALAQASGGFAVVQGTLQVHAARGGTLYLTLGHDRWGFAAVLTRRDAARFVKGGLDVQDYAGTPVRLRGDLDDRFGARLRLTDPDQIESLEPGTPDPPQAPSR